MFQLFVFVMILFQVVGSVRPLDVDNMPLCPPTDSPWSVVSSAWDAAREWHLPTRSEITHMRTFLKTFKSSLNQRHTKRRTRQLMKPLTALNLTMCRLNSTLIVSTLPRVRTYSGPFFFLNEQKTSDILVLSPHDGSDGTNVDTKLVLGDAFAVISNGYKKTPETDFVHNKETLGFYAFDYFTRLFPKSTIIHIHGSAAPDLVWLRSRDDVLKSKYESAVTACSNITAFTPLNAYFVVDDVVRTPKYLKTEIPAAIHMEQPDVFKCIIHRLHT